MTREHQDPWPVLELRQYTLRPGMRDTMIDLFDREFVETQEACGMRILGQFRDEDDPDRFVWLRAFHGMADRARALTEFYLDGEAWRTHAPAARETMLDTDDALLLRPLQPFPPLEQRPALLATSSTGRHADDSASSARRRADVSAPATSTRAAGIGPVVRYENRPDRPGAVATVHLDDRSSRSRIAATVYHLTAAAESGFADFFASRVRPLLTASGAEPIAVLATEPATNTFPRLPVRTGEHVLAWFAAFDDTEELERHRERLSTHPEWTGSVLPQLGRHLTAPTQELRLAPTTRSMLR